MVTLPTSLENILCKACIWFFLFAYNDITKESQLYTHTHTWWWYWWWWYGRHAHARSIWIVIKLHMYHRRPPNSHFTSPYINSMCILRACDHIHMLGCIYVLLGQCADLHTQTLCVYVVLCVCVRVCKCVRCMVEWNNAWKHSCECRRETRATTSSASSARQQMLSQSQLLISLVFVGLSLPIAE